jgi:hypothetical protein
MNCDMTPECPFGNIYSIISLSIYSRDSMINSMKIELNEKTKSSTVTKP